MSFLTDAVKFGLFPPSPTVYLRADKTGTSPIDAALQGVINSLEDGGTCIIPPGNYRWGTSPVYMRSNVKVVCEQGAVFDLTDLGTELAAIWFEGSAGSEIALSATATRGGTSISTVSAHGLAAGDLVRLISQRNAITVDAGRYSKTSLGAAPIATTNLLNTISITHTAHGAKAGDWVALSGATDTGGILAADLNTPYWISSITDANTYVVRAHSAASSTTTGGGSGITAYLSTNEWRLGHGTPSAQECHFAEFLSVREITDSDTFVSLQKLIFPDYRADNSMEWATTARAAATIAKIFPCVDSSWVGGAFITTTDIGSIFRSNYAHRCRVEDVSADRSVNQGSCVFWVRSFECEASGVRCFTDPALSEATIAGDHHLWNRFKTADSQGCGFDKCADYNGSQPFDFSYFGTPSVDCYVRNSETTNARKTAMTSHPGCFRIDVTNNRFLNCGEDGIAIRSRGGLIRGNKVTASVETNSTDKPYGIAVFEGWALNNLIDGNYVDGFYYGLHAYDGANYEEKFTITANQFVTNTVVRAEYGFLKFISVTSRNSLDTRLVISRNQFSQIGKSFITVEGYSPGCIIEHNVCNGKLTSASPIGIWAQANSSRQTVRFNTFFDIGSAATGINLSAVSDSTTFPGAVTSFLNRVFMNEFYGDQPGTKYSGSGTNLKVIDLREADRSGSLVIPDGITAPTQLASNTIIYVDSADGDLKVKFSDGVTKTLAVDT